MTTVSDIGISGIKRGMSFRDPNSSIVERYEIVSNVQPGFAGQYVDVTTHYTDNTISTTKWFDYEISQTGWAGGFELIEESSDNDKYYWEKYQSNPEPVKETCYHPNKKKVIMFVSGYWQCRDCGQALNDLTDEEFRLACKEQFGGKECSPDPRSKRKINK